MIGNSGWKKAGLVLLAVLYTCFGVKAQLMPPPDPFFELDSWSFNDTNWLSDLGYPPASFANLANPPGFDGNAVQVDATNAAWLHYNIVESDGTTNLTCNEGTIEIWVLPDWNSGTGPGDWGRIIDVGAYSTNRPSSWWSLYVSPDGNSLCFSSETNGVFTNYLSAPIAWDTNTWHLIDLTYRNSHSELYIDGQWVTNGPGVPYFPSPEVVSNGFFVGSDHTGLAQSRAQFDDLATCNYPLSLTEITNDYATGEQLINPVLSFSGGTFTQDSGSGLTPPGSGGGGSSDIQTNSPSVPINYGTNLWIAQVAIASNNLIGMASNTVADVEYEIQSIGDLTQTNWVSQGFILGSETTNMTPLNPLVVSRTTNSFIRLRSWADDGSGLPVWWQLQYFGYVGVDPNAQDSVGDGWTIYQKFQMGLNPNVFATPPAPQPNVSFNANNSIATVSWLPAPGPVTNYAITEYDDAGTTVYNLSPTNTSLQANLSADVENAIADYGSPNFYADFFVVAQYSKGNSPPGVAPVEDIPAPAVSLINGTQGKLFLDIQGLPGDLSKLEIYRQQNYWDVNGVMGDYQQDYSGIFNRPSAINDGYFEIPAADITNGVCQLPDAQLQPYFSYTLSIQTVCSNGAASTWATANPNYTGTTLASTPFLDARRQLKDNLQFLLRAANNTPVDFSVSGGANPEFTWPDNYVYAGFYASGNSSLYAYDGTYDFSFSWLRPFHDNFFYKNFVFDANNLQTGGWYDGWLNTGVANYWGYRSGPDIRTQYFFGTITITNYPQYYFNLGGFLTNTSPIAPSSQLSLSSTEWILPPSAAPGDIEAPTYPGNPIPANAANYYGLPLVSEEYAYVATDTPLLATCYPGNATPTSDIGGLFYADTAQPEFAIANYYFARVNYDPMPEMDDFSTANKTPFIIQGIGTSLQIAGYAQVSILNGNTNSYGYLGQYFAQAYSLDSNGNITTNFPGVLSPAGNFFATQPGPVALVTMPDIDTGEQGTCTVYAVSLQLDANHDGNMDLSFNGTDATSPANPMVFWANNNFDRWDFDVDDNTNYMDDVPPNSSEAWGDRGPNPDYNYPNYATLGNRCIPDTRDLEDFARLWVCGVTSNLLAALPAGSTVSLNWGDVGYPNPGNPTIDLFAAADTDGGIGYLTNSAIATLQTNITRCPFIGRLGPGQSLKLNASWFAGHWAGNDFIWCGVSNGFGSLTLTIADANSNVLAQSTSYVQIVDIKQMYERWTIGDMPSIALKTNAVPATEDLPIGASAFQYTQPQDTNTPYILFVHGWNMERWEKDCFAESAFKRLYWQGYHGRFGVFRWPTENGFTGKWYQFPLNPSIKDNFDRSEYTAWQSSVGLLNKLKDLNAEYPGHVYMLAHSMGNIVAGEALRLATQQGLGHLVNTYVASQAAVSAHTYDTNIANYSFNYPLVVSQATTPNIYGNWFLGNNGGGAGQVINFFNTNDFALQRSVWQLDQWLKPDQFVLLGGTHWDYSYLGMTNDPSPWNHFQKDASLQIWNEVNFDIVNVLTNRYEVMGLAAQPWTTAFGATPGVQNVSQDIDLTQFWPLDLVHPTHPFDEHFYHSAEFRGDYWQQQGYWNELLGPEVFNLK